MFALFAINTLVESSWRSFNKIGQPFLGNIFRSREHRQEWVVMLHTMSILDWTSGSKRQSVTSKTTMFFAFSTRLWACLVTESNKRHVAARMLAVVSLEGSIGLANGNIVCKKFSISWTLISRSLSHFETSRALESEFLAMPISGTKHVLVENKGFKVFLNIRRGAEAA